MSIEILEVVDVETLSPFEQAQFNIDEMCAGFALCKVISDLIKKSDELNVRMKDRTLSFDERREAIKDARIVNQQISLIAMLNETQYGISC